MTIDAGRPTLVHRFAHWRAVILVGVCIGSGLALDMLVLGSEPGDPVDAVAVAPTPVLTVGSGDGTTASTVDQATTITAPVAPSTAPPVATVGATVEAVPPASPAPVAPSPVQAAPVPAPAAATVIAPPTTSPPAPAPPATAPAAPSTPAPTPPATAPPATSPPAAATAPPSTAPPSTAPPSTAPPSTAPPSTAPPATIAAPSSVSYPSYEVPNVADVVLALTDESTITVWSVAPSANWVYKVERDGPRSVEVKFFNVRTQNEAEFHAELEGTRIKVEYGD